MSEQIQHEMLTAKDARAAGQPYAFLSSVFMEGAPDGNTSTALRVFEPRNRIREAGKEAGYPVWLAEKDAPELTADTPWAVNMAGCVEPLVEASLLIVVLSRRAGRQIKIDNRGLAASSIFEVELFHASQWKIPTVFYIVRGYEPEPELHNLINFLKLKDNHNWFVLDENEIEQHVRELLQHFKINSLSEEWKLWNIADKLSDGKSYIDIDKEIASTSLSFVGRFTPVDRTDFNMERVQEFLECAERESQNGSNINRFSFLWLAMRDLSIGDAREIVRAGPWVKIAREWPSVAAWLGLHGPLNTGVSAAFHTQNDLKRHGITPGSSIHYGGYASEFYSMGTICGRRDWKLRRFSAAAKLASQQAVAAPDPSGGLAVRASAQLQLARLGRPWLVWAALADYKEAVRLKEKRDAGNASVGDAYVEWGFAKYQVARFTRWGRRDALDLMRKGMRLLESAYGQSDAGFVIRAKRKLSQCLEQAGHPEEAEQQRNEGIAIAKKFGILSQLRQLKR